MTDAPAGQEHAAPAERMRDTLRPHERIALRLLWGFCALASAGAGLLGLELSPLAAGGLACLALAGAFLLVAHLIVRE